MGRPGWHIECSVMASVILGSDLDIHAGGIDLSFPHHENEIAQCQGYFKKSWVNYFLHTGHLNINGLKMSKSLKNFLTIKDIIKDHSPMCLRILFLQHFWNKDMNYDPSQLLEADVLLKKILNFISTGESLSKGKDIRSLNEKDRLLGQLDTTKINVDSALKSNFDTPKVLSLIFDLISEVNKDIKILHSDVLRYIVGFVNKITTIFGLKTNTIKVDGDSERIAELLNDFRNKVKFNIKNKDTKDSASKFYEICDEVRGSLKEYGFTIDDLKDGAVLRKNIN